MRNSWKAYFIFSVKEQKGIMVLGIVLLLSTVIGMLMPKPLVSSKIKKDQKEYASFNFDPNTIDSAHALLLGIPPRQISTLLHYRNKGGRFYRQQDLAHWYGLKKDLLEKLMPLVNIRKMDTMEVLKQNRITNYKYGYKYSGGERTKGYLIHDKNPMKELDWTIDINVATANEWMLSTHLSKITIESLLQYKQYLGGFQSVYQISKVYGIADSSFQRLRPHLRVQKTKSGKWIANLMTFEQWKKLELFQDKEIKQLLHFKKEHGGRIGLRDLVLNFDLTEMQANWLHNKISID
ncbi:MAG: helix-hairpin-helix domain-containing protein [Chitinophagia bacterium]